MSEQGKLFRGEAYYNMRNKIGDYPKGVTSNPNKMAELQFYLDSIKPKEVPKEEVKPKGRK